MRSRLLTALLALIAVGAGVTAASAVLPADDAPPHVHEAEGPDLLAPDPSTVQIAQAADSSGEDLVRATRTYETAGGLSCVNAGHLKDGDFGRLDTDGDFVELPVAADGACADFTAEPAAFAVRLDATRPSSALLYGRVSSDVQRVTLGDGEDVALNESGAFARIIARDDLGQEQLVFWMEDGTRTTFSLSQG